MVNLHNWLKSHLKMKGGIFLVLIKNYQEGKLLTDIRRG